MKTKSKKRLENTREWLKKIGSKAGEVYKADDGRHFILTDDGHYILFDRENRQVGVHHLEDGKWVWHSPYYSSPENWKYDSEVAPDQMKRCPHCGDAMASNEQDAHPRCEPVEA